MELDRKCSLALNSNRNEIKMHLETIDQFVFENEFNRVLQYSPLNLLSTEEYSSDIIKKSLFALGLNPLKEFQKEKSLIFLISGPSAVGKDAFLNKVFYMMFKMYIK